MTGLDRRQAPFLCRCGHELEDHLVTNDPPAPCYRCRSCRGWSVVDRPQHVHEWQAGPLVGRKGGEGQPGGAPVIAVVCACGEVQARVVPLP